MPSARLTLREEDVVRLALEFLHNRELHITQLSLERETGVINGAYSDDVLFLRQLILDGQWDDVLEFIQPLEALPTFDMRKFNYVILKHKYIELLCIKSEANTQGSSVDHAVEEVVNILSELEKYSPSKDEYSTMCLLLTLPRLTDHFSYKDWNPSNARVQCFREVYPLVSEFLPGDRKTDPTVNTCAKNDRLIQLIIKGILYESCVNYCQFKATGAKETQTQEMNFSRLLDGSVGFSDSDLSLLSWLQSIPSDTFSVPFEQRTLNVELEKLEKPSLETSWTEHMLITPIKPKTFPHSAMPFTRPRSAADIMSRSLMPALDGLPFGLAHNGRSAQNGNPRLMALSTGDILSNGPMSRSSFASFHLTGIKNSKLMNTSVDRLFENEGDVFLSNSYAEFLQLPSIQEQTSTPKTGPPPTSRPRSKSPSEKKSSASTPEHRGRDSPSSVSTARSSRRDSLNEKTMNNFMPPQINSVTPASNQVPSAAVLEHSFTGDLLKEFQRQKQKLQEALALREKEREELIRQFTSHDNRILEEGKAGANKPLNGGPIQNRSTSSPKPSMNGTGNHDIHRGPLRQDLEQRPQDAYDTVKCPSFDKGRNDPKTNAGFIDDDRPSARLPVLDQYDLSSVDTADPVIALLNLDQKPSTCLGWSKFPSHMGTAINHAAAIKRLEALFDDCKLERKSPEIVQVEHKHDIKCDVHGRNGLKRGSVGIISSTTNRRGSLGSGNFKSSYSIYTGNGGVGPRRESMPALNLQGNHYRRRESLGLPHTPPKKEMEHPSNFPSTLRRSEIGSSTGSLKRDLVFSSWNARRDSLGGSTNSLKRDNNNLLHVPNGNRRHSRRFSNDSLDSRRNSWDVGRRGSSGSSGGWDDPIMEDVSKPVARTKELDVTDNSGASRPRFVAVTALEDVQAVRCAEFHPGGQLYAVGSNSKTLRICAYPKLADLREDHQTYQPMVLFKRTKHHKGSIYCLAWSPVGDLMATGSNDKTVKLMRFNADTSNLEGEEVELTMHDGTIRDLCFLEDTSNKSSLLISGGAGDCKIYVTDCATGTPFQALSGHTGHILSLYTWGGAMFVSGSHDKTIRFWDLRTRGCVNMVTPITVPGTRQGSPVASLCVDPSGRLLVSGHEDSSCVLYDIRGGRNIQCFKPHTADARSIRFSPSAYYLLTGGYDNKLVLTDLQGDLTLPLPSVVVAQHQDKVISGRWHPTEFSFLSTSADKTATLWALPPI